jgi:zinc/manganese transport system substrate-binding protein
MMKAPLGKPARPEPALPRHRMRVRRSALGAAACGILWAAMGCYAHAQHAPIAIVAAESFYGNVAGQIGGPAVKVISIVSTPAQDPHRFEASPATARALSAANLVIYNGANYDPWIEKLLASAKSGQRRAIVAADIMKVKPGDNPHLWYDPATMPAVGARIASELAAIDPAHKDIYERRLKIFVDSLAPIADKTRAIKARYAGTPVTATEPVFGYMAKALGLDMRNERFQLAVMNDTEPSARDVAAMQDDLKHRNVKLLLYNSQVSDDLTARLLELASTAKVPVVGVTETAPGDKSYQDWIAEELGAVEKALDAGGRL